MADIFISYASDDRSRAETIAKALEEQGWSVWWDRTIPPGKTFDQVIEEAINAARCVVVLWSRKSIKSDWVKEEANIGKERKILVPAKIDPVNLPLGFGRIQAADLTNWEAEKEHPGFFSLRNAISEVAGPPPERDKSVPNIKLPESNMEQQGKLNSEESETFQPDASHLRSDAKESLIAGPKAPRKKRLAYGIGAVALIFIIGAIAFFVFIKTITAISDPNGSLSPSGSVSVFYGGSKTFKITPNPGYDIADVMVDGESVGPKSSYVFNKVIRDSTIEAIFAAKSYNIMVSSSKNGRISPSGDVTVTDGNSMEFTITPDPGYYISDVIVDGKSVGPKPGYVFNNVMGGHTLEASFKQLYVYIWISKFQRVWSDSGSGATRAVTFFRPIPSPGYEILGHYAIGSYDDPNERGRVLAVKKNEKRLLANPVDYHQIWNDRGSGAKQDVAVWRPISPPGYSCLGDVATLGYQKPSLREIVCVRNDAVENGRVGSLIWDDRNSGANQDVSIWRVEPTSKNGINAGLFQAVRSHNPPKQALPVLKRMID